MDFKLREKLFGSNKSSATGTSLLLNDTIKYPLDKLSIDGMCEQQKNSGKNLLDKSQTNSLTNSTIDNDDWITAEYDNTGGENTIYCNFFTNIPNEINLQPDTNYNIILEIKSIVTNDTTNNSYISVTSDNQNFAFEGSPNNIPIKDLAPNTVYSYILSTKSDLTNINGFLRTFISVFKNKKVKIVYRLSVIVDTSITPQTFYYEPYIGGQVSPSPDYPSEIEIVKGKNLFDKDNANILNGYVTANELKSRGSNRTIYIPVVPEKKYTIQKSVGGVGLMYCFTSNIPQIGSNDILGYVGNADFNSTVTSPSGGNYLCVTIYRDNDSSYTLENVLGGLQIEQGSVRTPYSPYGNIQFAATGKNLFNVSNKTITHGGITGTITNNCELDYSGIAANNWADITDNTIVTLQKGTYTFSIDKPTDKNENIVLYLFGDTTQYMIINGGTTSKTITLNEDKTRFRVGLTGLTSDTSYSGTFKMQLEKSSTPTPYEPYKENIVNIDLQGYELCSIGDIKDELIVKDGRAKIIKRIGKVILNGSESGVYSFFENSGDYNQINADLGITNIDITNRYDFYCNYFDFYANATGTKTQSGMVKYGINPNFVFSVPKTIVTSVSSWREWLSTHNVIIYYPLKTLQEIDLGVVDMPYTYNNETHMSINSNLNPTLNVDYYAGFSDLSNYEFNIKEV